MDKTRSTIASMFNRIAGKYDFLNRLLSFGVDVRWRKKMMSYFPPKFPIKVLDVATGTADVAVMMVDQCGSHRFSKIVGVDISDQMLDVGRKKVAKRQLESLISLRYGDATELEFEASYFDALTIAFGIRNVVDTAQALREFYRVISSGGRVIILEFSLPQNPIVKAFYLAYFRHFLPFIGGVVSRDHQAYQYLNQSVEHFVYGDAFCQLMDKAGFLNVKSVPLLFGIATIYIGEK
jgi:demethylmenaquinone methyltransferase/2-methoxy-6-polyprenyl-1,4-benzoquinol methylase